MKTENALITENIRIAAGVYRMELETTLAEDMRCGQFVQVEIPGYFLRRPISVSYVNGERTTMTLVYKVVGEGTQIMSKMKAGEKVNLFGMLGNGFPVEDRDVLLIGGGVGVPPLVQTAKEYRRKDRKVTVVLGFNTENDVILTEEFASLGCTVYGATMDGSWGTKGTVLDAVSENEIDETFVLACGPAPMLRAINESYEEGYISLEARMACGMGTCMGCVVKDTEGESLRVCKDGPVFPIGKVVL